MGAQALHARAPLSFFLFKPSATIQIDGKVSKLIRIYVHAVESTGWIPKLPTVEYVDLYGIDEDGKPVKERVKP